MKSLHKWGLFACWEFRRAWCWDKRAGDSCRTVE